MLVFSSLRKKERLDQNKAKGNEVRLFVLLRLSAVLHGEESFKEVLELIVMCRMCVLFSRSGYVISDYRLDLPAKRRLPVGDKDMQIKSENFFPGLVHQWCSESKRLI